MQQLDFGSSFESGSGGIYVPFDASDRHEATPEFSSTSALVRHLKENFEDFEWYPTTPEIADCIKADMLQYSNDRDNNGMPNCSVLDIGAGTGSLLTRLTSGPKFAIELSRTLVQQMPADIFVIGSDFNSQSLVDKRASIVVSNPPYKDFSAWSTRIITEANASIVYLVIPKRWEADSDIQNAIKSRRAEATVIGKFDFLEADRKARAFVHVIRIDLRSKYYRDSSFSRVSNAAVDPFVHWFDTEFMAQVTPDRSAAYLKRMEQIEETAALKSSSELVTANGLVNVLSSLYERELEQLMELYKGIFSMPSDIAAELDINKCKIRDSLRAKVNGLKAKYWQELFDRIDTVTNRLTSGYRRKMLDKLNSHTTVDFSVSNAESILIWVIKQANECSDPQLVELVETMTEEANIKLYKRNQNTIKISRWRYDRVINIGAYALDYQFILHDVGAQSQRGNDLLNDLVTVACTLGFDVDGNIRAESRNATGSAENFYFMCHKTKKKEILFSARRYQNGNIHLRLNNQFLMKLNCKFGQLKGWLKSVDDVVQEMDISNEEAAEIFDIQLKLGVLTDPLLMLDMKAA
jgi:hypothetical protein